MEVLGGGAEGYTVSYMETIRIGLINQFTMFKDIYPMAVTVVTGVVDHVSAMKPLILIFSYHPSHCQ